MNPEADVHEHCWHGTLNTTVGSSESGAMRCCYCNEPYRPLVTPTQTIPRPHGPYA